MIGNRATRGHGEGSDHFKTKELAGVLADRGISPLASELGYSLLTLYEFAFLPVRLAEYEDVCDRLYVGDVVCLFFRDVNTFRDIRSKSNTYTDGQIQQQADHIIDYEIDGIKGHSKPKEKSKNQIRDEELMNRFGIHVCRIPVYDGKERKTMTAVLGEDEILGFYFNHLPRMIKNAR